MKSVIAGLMAALALCCTGAAGSERRPASVEDCVPCHGIDGIARDSEVPHLAGQNERYLYNQMLAFKNGSRRHREMLYMARELTQAELAALAAYFAALPPR